MAANIQWQWDPNYRQYYYLTENEYVYQNGHRVPLNRQRGASISSGSSSHASASSSNPIPSLSNLSLQPDIATPTPSHGTYPQTSYVQPQPAPHGYTYQPQSQSPPQSGSSSSQQIFQYSIHGTKGEQESLDPKYKIRRPPDEFFVEGKVFRILWSEPAGAGIRGNEDCVTIGPFKESIHTKIRWFVVYREGPTSCLCLPIQTYAGQGVAKRSEIKAHHSIAYTGSKAPSARTDEQPASIERGMQRPIRVKARSRGDKLDPMSRINFAKLFNVEHNVKVYEFGDVADDSMKQLFRNFDKVNAMLSKHAARQSGEESEEYGEEEYDASTVAQSSANPRQILSQIQRINEETDEDDDETAAGGEADPHEMASIRNAVLSHHTRYVNHYVAVWRSTNKKEDLDRARYIENASYEDQVAYLRRMGIDTQKLTNT